MNKLSYVTQITSTRRFENSALTFSSHIFLLYMESLQVGNNSCTYVRGSISSSHWTLKLAKREESYRAGRSAGGQGRSRVGEVKLKIQR